MDSNKGTLHMIPVEVGSAPLVSTSSFGTEYYLLPSGHRLTQDKSTRQYTVHYENRHFRENAREMYRIHRKYGMYTTLSVILDVHRFLVACKDKPKQAAERYRKFTIFLDTFYQSVAPTAYVHPATHAHLSQYSADICQTFCGFDQRGFPVILSQPGKIQVRSFLSKYKGSLLRKCHIWCQERLRRLCAHAKVPTYQVRVILDLAGVEVQHLKLIQAFRTMSKIDARYFPETMKDITIINVPKMFQRIYQIVCTFIDPDTLKKVHITNQPDPQIILTQRFPGVDVSL